MVNGNLPDGWVMSTLGKVATAQSGAGFPKTFQGQTSGEYPLAKVSDITESVKFNGGVIAKANNYLSADEAKKLGAKVFPEGTTLFAKIGEALRLNRRALSSLPILADNNVMGLIPDRDQIFSKYLYYFMQTVDLSEYSQATTVPSVRKSDIENIEFPLPPLPEQEQIVAKIEELFTQLEAGTSALERVQAGLRRYKASVLKAAVEGKLGIQNEEFRIEEGELPEGWRWATVGDVAESMKNGIYKAAEFYSDNGVACLRMYNIEEGNIVWKDIKRMILTEEELETYRLLPGDILVNRVNSRELVGKAAVIPDGIELTVYESKNIRLKIKKEIADSKFVNYCFGAYRQQYFNYNAQQVVGMASINQTQISQMPIPLPPLEEQRRIVAEVERRLSVAREVESVVEKALVRAKRLRQAVLKHAFEGKL